MVLQMLCYLKVLGFRNTSWNTHPLPGLVNVHIAYPAVDKYWIENNYCSIFYIALVSILYVFHYISCFRLHFWKEKWVQTLNEMRMRLCRFSTLALDCGVQTTLHITGFLPHPHPQ